MNRLVIKTKYQKIHIRYVNNVSTTDIFPMDHQIILKHKTNHNIPKWRSIQIQALLRGLYYLYTKRTTWKKYNI